MIKFKISLLSLTYKVLKTTHHILLFYLTLLKKLLFVEKIYYFNKLYYVVVKYSLYILLKSFNNNFTI